MNIREINEFRISHGLAPLPTVAKKNRQNEKNRQARAQECRDLKAARNRKGK